MMSARDHRGRGRHLIRLTAGDFNFAERSLSRDAEHPLGEASQSVRVDTHRIQRGVPARRMPGIDTFVPQPQDNDRGQTGMYQDGDSDH
jgi:hypothetical protein